MVSHLPRRRALSLVEVLIGAALLCLTGATALAMVTSGSRHATHAGEREAAALIGARAIDRAIAGGEVERRRTGLLPVVVDGVRYATTWRRERADSGLERIVVSVTWTKAGSAERGTLVLTRCVADTWAGLAVRGPE